MARIVKSAHDGRGMSWQPLQIPPRFYVHDAQVSPEGRAWLVGDCGIVISEDYGAT